MKPTTVNRPRLRLKRPASPRTARCARVKRAADPHTPPVLTYATGIDEWQRSAKWPMGAKQAIYLAADGKAGLARPTTALI